LIVTIILGIFSVFFAYIAKFKNQEWGLKLSFTFIFIFLALRYNFGNDYESYYSIFNYIAQDNQNAISYLHLEPGWKLINWLFRDLGFFSMTVVLALINCIIYYRFIKKYVQVSYYWLAIFFYIFNPNFMLIHSSAMRQSAAIMIFIFSLDYLYKKELIRYILCIAVASLFHYSALLLLPVFLLAFFNKKINIISGSIIFTIYISLYLFWEILSPYLTEFISSFYEKYNYYQERGKINSGLGILFYSVIFILILYFEKIQSREIGLIFKLTIVSFLIMPLSLIILMTGRFGMYFAPATIIVYPSILINLNKPGNKIIISTILILFTIFQFFQFFYSDIYQNYFMNYQTIFSSPNW
jgi:transmembrane protein EpsG